MREAAEVADVLADRERAVDVVARRRACAGASASYWAMSAFVRSSNAARSASVHQSVRRPSPSYFDALVVEAVPDLVADDRADRAVVGRGVALGVEERVLQDRRGEHDLVEAAGCSTR